MDFTKIHLSKIHPRNPLLRLGVAGGDFGGLLGELGALLGGHHGHLSLQHVVLQGRSEIGGILLGLPAAFLAASAAISAWEWAMDTAASACS